LIVIQAHLSQLSLFSYFNIKKEPYCYLISYSTQNLENMYEEIDLSETDLFNRIENIGLQKSYVQQNHPEIFDFLKSTIEEESLEIKSIIEQHVSRIYEDGRQKYVLISTIPNFVMI